MTKEEIISKVNAMLAEEFEVEEKVITPDANIKKTLELDSLSLVDLVALIDGEFGIKTNGAEMSKVGTFGELYSFIESKIA
ncbi:MAG: phosphopantetheine-binding protein [Paludibacteraceae bacterium]|nr:phosphopantetheine-binding protein [Paludibacteraceae bacterium]